MAEHADAGGATGIAAGILALIGALGAAWRGKTLGEKVDTLVHDVGALDVRVATVETAAAERRHTGERFEDRAEEMFGLLFRKLDEVKDEIAALRVQHRG